MAVGLMSAEASNMETDDNLHLEMEVTSDIPDAVRSHLASAPSCGEIDSSLGQKADCRNAHCGPDERVSQT